MTEKNQMQHHHKYFEEFSDIHDKQVLQMLPERNSLKRQVNRTESRLQAPNPASPHGSQILEEYKVTIFHT